MLVAYDPICNAYHLFRFCKEVAECASDLSHATRDKGIYGASCSVWLIPGTGED